MSFSTEQKEYIINQQFKNQCCRRALLYGILFPKASVEGNLISLTVDGEDVREFVSRLVFEVFSKTPDISPMPKGGRGRVLSFSSSAYIKYVKEISLGVSHS